MPDYGINYKLYDLSSSGIVTPTAGGAQMIVREMVAPNIAAVPVGADVSFATPVTLTVPARSSLFQPCMFGLLTNYASTVGVGTPNGVALYVDGVQATNLFGGAFANIEQSFTSSITRVLLPQAQASSGFFVSTVSPFPLAPHKSVMPNADSFWQFFFTSAGSHVFELKATGGAGAAGTITLTNTYLWALTGSSASSD